MEDFIYWLIGASVAIVGTFFGIKYSRSGNKYSVLQLARDTKKDADELAEKLADKNKQVALEVKQDMKDHIDRLINVLKQDIELSRTQTYARIDTLDIHIQQNKIDLAKSIENIQDDLERQQRSIEFLQTMAWGPDAKSIPPYMFGTEETQEHKDEPSKGAFKDRTPEDEEERRKFLESGELSAHEKQEEKGHKRSERERERERKLKKQSSSFSFIF